MFVDRLSVRSAVLSTQHVLNEATESAAGIFPRTYRPLPVPTAYTGSRSTPSLPLRRALQGTNSTFQATPVRGPRYPSPPPFLPMLLGRGVRRWLLAGLGLGYRRTPGLRQASARPPGHYFSLAPGGRLPYRAPHLCHKTTAAPLGQGTRPGAPLPGLWREGSCETGRRVIIPGTAYGAGSGMAREEGAQEDVSGKQGTRDAERKGHSEAGGTGREGSADGRGPGAGMQVLQQVQIGPDCSSENDPRTTVWAGCRGTRLATL